MQGNRKTGRGICETIVGSESSKRTDPTWSLNRKKSSWGEKTSPITVWAYLKSLR